MQINKIQRVEDKRKKCGQTSALHENKIIYKTKVQLIFHYYIHAMLRFFNAKPVRSSHQSSLNISESLRQKLRPYANRREHFLQNL